MEYISIFDLDMNLLFSIDTWQTNGSQTVECPPVYEYRRNIK